MELQRVGELYEQGQYLTAYEETQRHGPITQWQGAEARVMAGRLGYHLGGFRVSRLMICRAWRQAPTNPEVAYYYAYNVLQKRGPWGAWRFLTSYGELNSPTRDTLSSWYTLIGQVAGIMRDFETADSWLAKATEIWPDSPWIRTVQSHLLETEDRYDEALEKAEEAISLRPWFRPAIQTKASLLTLLDRDQESIDLLKDSLNHIQSAALAQQLAASYLELRDYEKAWETLERVRGLAPLLDKQGKKWFAACEADIHYFRGDYDAAVNSAKEAGEGFFAVMAERLADPERRKATRKSLNIPFVRQHHLTCVPATLTAIAKYWDRPVDHVEIANQICYAGTSALNERRWAEENGWVTREFTVTEECVKQLIDADIPCTLTTTQPGNAHMQAIEGYDARRGTLLIIDPFVRVAEGIADKLLENQASSGPRGMAMVPEANRAALESLDLPDAQLWDMLHELDSCLDRHDRDAAILVLQRMDSSAADHRVTMDAHRRLAIYDADVEQLARVLTRFREQFPDDDVLNLQWLSVMRDQANRDERLQAFESLSNRPECHPLIRREYASELAADSSQLPKALALLKRVLRQMPADGRTFHAYALALWDLGNEHRQEALELFRFAACLEERDEVLSEAYLVAAHHFRQTDIALDFLRQRFQRHGDKSGWPAQTLSDAYRRLCREKEAIQVLEKAVRLRPDDGDLAAYAVDTLASAGTQYLPRAEELLASAQGKTSEVRYLRADAFLAAIKGELTRALAAWKKIVASQPLSTEAHSSIARLLAETQGIDAALDSLDAAAEKFPHHVPIQEMRISWLRDETPERAEEAIRTTLARMPNNAWMIRELAFLLIERGNEEEAAALAAQAHEIDDRSRSHHHLLAAIFRRRGDLSAARDEYRAAIELGVDNIHAISELIECCPTPEDRRDELMYVKGQLHTQVVFGDAIVAFRGLARETLSAEEILDVLQTAKEEWPDLWQTWSALQQQLVDMNRLTDAAGIVEEATERFPLIPRIWLDRATISRVQGDFKNELVALETAWKISPYWHPAVDALCAAHERNRHYDKARTLLEQLVQSDPLQSRHHSRLAELLWEMDERDAALERAERAVQIAPGNHDAWRMLHQFSLSVDQPTRPAELARELTQKRPNEPRSWLTLVRTLDGEETHAESHEALDRAIQLDDRCEDAYSLRAMVFADAGEFDQAVAACNPAVFGDSPPFDLKLTESRIVAQFQGPSPAIDILQKALDKEPEFHSGWIQLSDWYRDTDKRKDLLRCCEQMVRLEPHEAVSLAYLGEAYLNNERKEDALSTFQRAFELSPSYEFAGISVFDLLIGLKRDGDQAAIALAVLQTYCGDSPRTQARVVHLAAFRDLTDEAEQAFADLCVMSGEIGWALQDALQSLRDCGGGKTGVRWLGNAVQHSDANPEVATAWGVLSVSEGVDLEGTIIQGLVHRPEIFSLAADEYLDELLQNAHENIALPFIERHRERLHANDRNWGRVGYVYATLYKYKEAASWLADWRDRQGLQPWKLFNLVEALRALNRDKEARQVGEAALLLPDVDHTSDLHMIWLAADDPIRYEELRQTCVERIDPEAIHPSLKFMWHLVVALDETIRRAAPFDLVKKRVEAAIDEYGEGLKKEPGHRRFLRRAMAKISRQHWSLAAKLWGLSRWKYR